MGRCKPMYGLDSNAVETLRTRFRKLSGDREWHCADDFVKWASENGFKKSARIYKIDENKPHGPNNSYWMKGDSKEAKERYTNEIKKDVHSAGIVSKISAIQVLDAKNGGIISRKTGTRISMCVRRCR